MSDDYRGDSAIDLDLGMDRGELAFLADDLDRDCPRCFQPAQPLLTDDDFEDAVEPLFRCRECGQECKRLEAHHQEGVVRSCDCCTGCYAAFERDADEEARWSRADERYEEREA